MIKFMTLHSPPPPLGDSIAMCQKQASNTTTSAPSTFAAVTYFYHLEDGQQLQQAMRDSVSEYAIVIISSLSLQVEADMLQSSPSICRAGAP